ncbi:CD82 isoform 2, partial [Pan troglodytes]
DNSLSVRKGFCEAPGNRTQSGNHPEDWPVYQELLGMVLSICLCRHVHSEDYSKVPKY